MGPLKQILYNETVELEPEMVVGILKDVASALKYLHQQDPPCLDKELTTAGVVLDHDHTAQMLHIHISTVCSQLRCFLYTMTTLPKFCINICTPSAC